MRTITPTSWRGCGVIDLASLMVRSRALRAASRTMRPDPGRVLRDGRKSALLVTRGSTARPPSRVMSAYSAGVKTTPANIATFRVGTDGKLTFANNYEVETGGELQFWSGMVAAG